jgi:Fe-S oxidoreductase
MKWFMDALLGIDKRRRMPRFGFSSFIKKANKYLAKQSKLENPVDKVAYFTDTFVNYNDHELGFAAVKFLRANNIEVVVPAQRPAPLPAVVYGDVKTSRKDLQYNVENLAKAVKQGYKIICSEPSAALCLKEDLRFFVDSDDARCVSENTFEFFEYLKNLINQKKLDSRFRGNDEILRCAQNDEILRCAQNDEILRCAQNDNPAKVLAGLTKPPASAFAKGLRTDRQVRGLTDRYVHHTPCHLFALERQPATMEVLKKLAGIEAEELDGGCCGIAGTFGMQKKNYDLSMKIGRRLAEKIEESNADVILTECSTCKMQIEHTTGRKVEHPIKVLAKVYGLIGN